MHVHTSTCKKGVLILKYRFDDGSRACSVEIVKGKLLEVGSDGVALKVSTSFAMEFVHFFIWLDIRLATFCPSAVTSAVNTLNS